MCGWESKYNQMPTTPLPTTPPKSMEAPDVKLKITPSMLKLFKDKDELQDLLECLSDEELSIIVQHPDDVQILMTLVNNVREDVNETAKDLAMN